VSPAAARTGAVAAACPDLSGMRRKILFAGIAGILLMLVGRFLDPAQFYRSYLLGYVLWAGIALGCMGILMLQHLSGGAWGVVVRRILEAGTRTLPLLFILFVPLLTGIGRIYPWADPAAVASDEVLRHKSAYLNPTGFTLRAVIYFLIWCALAYFLGRWSEEQDRTADPGLPDRLGKLSGAGIALYVLTMTFASVDWLMSLEPHWFSTIYGIFIVMGQVLSGMAFAIIVLALLSARAPLHGKVGARHFHDLGKLLFAFVLVWSYFAFSQFLIIWSGNLPEEIPWYLKRLEGGWQYVALALVLLQFAVPFVLLLSARIKRQPVQLARLAAFLVVMRVVDLAWTIGPAMRGGRGFGVHWMDVAAPVAVGGLWLAYFLRNLQARPLLPAGDPFLMESIDHGR
jgi:hypothetical protein